MQTTESLNAAIRQMFSERLFIEVPGDDVDLIEMGIMESLTLVGLLAQMESEYGLTVDLDTLDIDDFRSVNRIAAYLSRCREE